MRDDVIIIGKRAYEELKEALGHAVMYCDLVIDSKEVKSILVKVNSFDIHFVE